MLRSDNSVIRVSHDEWARHKTNDGVGTFVSFVFHENRRVRVPLVRGENVTRSGGYAIRTAQGESERGRGAGIGDGDGGPLSMGPPASGARSRFVGHGRLATTAVR